MVAYLRMRVRHAARGMSLVGQPASQPAIGGIAIVSTWLCVKGVFSSEWA